MEAIKSMPPPISYYGGKQRIASKLIPYIPKHTVYCEPFCGGATILFKKSFPKVTDMSNYREVINDTDGDLINFFTKLRDNGKELVDKLYFTLYSEQEHKISKDLNIDDDLERARRYYINIQQSFNNKLNAGWKRGVYSQNIALTWLNKVNNLHKYIERMRQVYISNADALKCIKQWDSPQTFFFIDPPYMNANQGHYSGYTQEEYENLIELLKTVKGSFILTNYVEIEGVDWRKVEIKTYCSASGKGKVGLNRARKATEKELGNRKRTEIIYIKQSEEPRPEIKKLYESGKYDCFTG